MPSVDFGQFIVFFGFYEMVIGISFLFPRLVWLSILMLAIHMVTTMMPLVLLPAIAWTKPLIPTLEGQYIIKNVVIVALAISIVSAMHHPDDTRKELLRRLPRELQALHCWLRGVSTRACQDVPPEMALPSFCAASLASPYRT